MGATDVVHGSVLSLIGANVAVQSFCKLGFVVRVDLRVVPALRHRDVRHSAVDQFLPSLGVHVDENAVGSLALTAVACHRVPVVEMGILSDIECYSAARVETNSEIAAGIDLFNGAQLTVSDTLLPDPVR